MNVIKIRNNINSFTFNFFNLIITCYFNYKTQYIKLLILTWYIILQSCFYLCSNVNHSIQNYTCTLKNICITVYEHAKLLQWFWLLETPWTAGCQAPLCMRFSRQQHWSGLLCSQLGNLPNPGIKLKSLMSPALAGGFFTTTATWEAIYYIYHLFFT